VRGKGQDRRQAPLPGDGWAPKELLEHKDAAHRERIEGERAAIKQLKAQAATERAELESYIVTSRG
jgi:hypothetical protein